MDPQAVEITLIWDCSQTYCQRALPKVQKALVGFEKREQILETANHESQKGR